jgi:hypothetical protein
MKQNNRQLAIAKKIKKWIQITQEVVQLLFLCTKNKFFDRTAKWFTFLSAHVKAAMISLNSRLYSFPEYDAGWSPQFYTVAALKSRRSLVFNIPLL